MAKQKNTVVIILGVLLVASVVGLVTLVIVKPWCTKDVCAKHAYAALRATGPIAFEVAADCSSKLRDENKRQPMCDQHFAGCCPPGCQNNKACINECVNTGNQYCIPALDPGPWGPDGPPRPYGPDGGDIGNDGGDIGNDGGDEPPRPEPRPYEGSGAQGFLSTPAGKVTVGVGAGVLLVLVLVVIVMVMGKGKGRRRR